uniref:LysR substrate-binding domain-containing protein n=1 Tax=Burkholderia sp. M701 TaxID=326454 RepID=UPI001E30382E|nr:LysR substrate-binding domain-containing protein [Burkholderia sp. M701]
MRRAGVEPRVTAIVEDVNAALGLVAAGAGVTLVPASVAMLRRPFVRMIEMAAASAQVPVSLTYLTESRVPVLRAFLDAARRLWPGTQAGRLASTAKAVADLANHYAGLSVTRLLFNNQPRRSCLS